MSQSLMGTWSILAMGPPTSRNGRKEFSLEPMRRQGAFLERQEAAMAGTSRQEAAMLGTTAQMLQMEEVPMTEKARLQVQLQEQVEAQLAAMTAQAEARVMARAGPPVKPMQPVQPATGRS